MLLSSLSSASSASWVGVWSLLPYKPSRTSRRTNAPMRCLSYVVANPHQAGEAYSNLASTTDLYISFSASTHMPWLRRTFIASLIDKWSVTVIPRILICVARWMSGSVGGYWARSAILEDNFYGPDLIQFSFKLFLCAHSATWSSSGLSISGRDYYVGIVWILVQRISWCHSG